MIPLSKLIKHGGQLKWSQPVFLEIFLRSFQVIPADLMNVQAETVCCPDEKKQNNKIFFLTGYKVKKVHERTQTHPQKKTINKKQDFHAFFHH